MHPRGKLATFVWPDSKPHDARHALRIVIALLRTLLDDAEGQEPHLLSQRDALGLNPQAPLELDLEVVQQAHHQAQQHSTTPSEEQRAALVAQFQCALALVRGPFLDGFWLREETAFDEWALQEQQQWQVRLPLLLDRLSSWQETGGGGGRAPLSPPPPAGRAPRSGGGALPRPHGQPSAGGSAAASRGR